MIRPAAVSAAMWIAAFAGSATAEITGADYRLPTDVYGHGAVPGGEYAALEVRIAPDRVVGAGTFENVYEDTAPRLADLDGDGTPEVVTVISYFDSGAAIRIFDEIPAADGATDTALAVVAETAPIGTRHRWLAIAGIGDLDGDGRVEIAYIDRPHLAKVLRIIEVTRNGDTWSLHEEATAQGFTNHRYRAPKIEGGLRLCDTPELILATADWARVVAVSWRGGVLTQVDQGPYDGPGSMVSAMVCS